MEPEMEPELVESLTWNRLYMDLCANSSSCQTKPTAVGEATTDLTDEQMKVLNELFGLFDHHGVQTIAIDELGTLMRALGQIPTEAQMKQIVEEIDADGNGAMEYYEFVDLMTRVPWGVQGSQDEFASAVHATFADDEDGRISAAEFRHVLTNEGEKLTDEEVDMLLKQLEPDGEGRVSSQDIIKKVFKDPKKPKTCLTIN